MAVVDLSTRYVLDVETAFKDSDQEHHHGPGDDSSNSAPVEALKSRVRVKDATVGE